MLLLALALVVVKVAGGQGAGDQAVQVVLDRGFCRDDGGAFEVSMAFDR